MHALANKRLSRKLTFIASLLILAGCGEGDGPQSIAGTPATPVPPIPAGFCDAIGFEILCTPPVINNFNGGATIVIDNPDKSGINVSDRVAQMQKFADEVFGGTKLDLAEAIDFSQGEFYKVKVWSPRAVNVAFKLEETGNPGGGLTKELVHSGGGNWQELCFDFTGQTVPPPVVALTIIFDLGVLGQAAVDPGNWTFYYDDIEQVASCAGGGGGGAVSIDPDAALYSSSGNADLVIPDDYAEVTPFGSGSVIDPFFADDATYSPVLAVTSGTGYGANIAQLGYVGFTAGFAGAYETLVFKVKGMPNQVVFAKLFDNVSALRINLTSSAFSESLGDGWFQVSIPLSRFSGVDQATGIVFESDNSAAAQFTMLLSDIGFSGTGTGGGGGGGGGTGVVPDDVVYATDPGETVDLPPPAIENFGSGAVFDFTYAGDADYNPALRVTSGEGYGAGVHVGFIALTGYAPGFAAGYETFNFKVKDLPLGTLEVKFIEGGDTSIIYDVTTYAGSTDLGNGWYQVTIPMSDFAATIDNNQGFLLGPAGGQAGPFSFLLTDIGFSGSTGGGGGGAGITPEAVVYATDPGVTEDLAPPAIDNFGSGAVFNGAFAGDADYNPAFQVTSGEGYGAGVHVGFVAFNGYAAGFASGYGTFEFKAKINDIAASQPFEVKFINGGDTSVLYDLTTYAGSTDLGNGWYQVQIPMTDFAANIAANSGFLMGPAGGQANPFTMLLTDIGFSGSTGGGGGGAGITPEAVVYATDPGVTEDLAPPAIDNFGSGAVFNGAFAGDADYNPAFQVTSGEGYGAGVHVGFVAFNGYAAGFASGYGTFEFKAKINDIAASQPFEVKFINGGDTSVLYDLTTYAGSTDLGNGWYQVQIPMTDFAANIAANSGFLMGPAGGQANPFTMLLTDIGFSGTAGGGGGGGTGNFLGIVPNGDFETGVLDDPPWKTFTNNGIVEVSSAQSTSGTFSVHLQASVPGGGGAASFPTLKVERLEEGNLTGGESVTVSFDAIAVTQLPGAVPFFAQLFTERSGVDTGASDELLIQPPQFLTDSWVTYTFNTTLGPDAGGGVSLLFKADCGASPGCELDAYVDNVSIVIN